MFRRAFCIMHWLVYFYFDCNVTEVVFGRSNRSIFCATGYASSVPVDAPECFVRFEAGAGEKGAPPQELCTPSVVFCSLQSVAMSVSVALDSSFFCETSRSMCRSRNFCFLQGGAVEYRWGVIDGCWVGTSQSVTRNTANN